MLNVLQSWLLSIPFPWSLVTLCVSMAIVAVLAYMSHQLTVSGMVMAWLEGVVIAWTVGLQGLATMLLFFLSAAVMGKLSQKMLQAKNTQAIQKKHGARDWMQVVANGLPATLAGLLYMVSPTPVALVMFGAAVAEAASDTWAGDIGILSPNKPVSILTMKRVEPGLSGGISLRGTLGGVAGALVIALFWFGCYGDLSGMTTWTWVGYASLVAASGFFGCLLDSILGALIQAHYWDDERKQLTEHEFIDGKQLELSRGICWVDNDIVNLISNLFSMLLAGGLAMAIH